MLIMTREHDKIMKSGNAVAARQQRKKRKARRNAEKIQSGLSERHKRLTAHQPIQ